MPCIRGSVFIMYSTVVNPGISMSTQATRPGRLKALRTDVLPMPYHEMKSCMSESYSTGPR